MIFSQLVYLARIDQQLRDVLLLMTLDTEHFCKTKLIAECAITEEDSYTIVADYKASLDDERRQYIEDEIEKRKDNPYCRHIIEKHGAQMPLDAFVEVISFGTFLGVVYYCGKHRIGGQRIADYAVLHAIKSLRNACAHSACILLELNPGANGERVAPNEVSNAVSAIGVSKRARRRWLQAVPVAQIASLLFQYSEIVPADSTRTKRLKELNEFLSNVENGSVLPAKNPAKAALSFLKRLTKGFGLIE